VRVAGFSERPGFHWKMPVQPSPKIVFSAAVGAVVLACTVTATVGTGFNEVNAPYDAKVVSDYTRALAAI
jgi:hypothetical protein